MTAATSFFGERRPAAVLKHGILRRYLRPFASKTGRWSKDNRVVCLDGFAGPGKYTDGSPGSPALAIQTAEAVSASRNLECVYVEQDEESCDELCELLAPFERWTVYNGSVDDVLDEVMAEEVRDSPMFALIDPFGLAGVSFDMLTKILARPKRVGNTWQPATELLLNISISGIRRNAGHLTSRKEYPARKALLENVDRYFGGDWWRAIWSSGDDDRVSQIVTEYCTRLAATGTGGRWAWWWFEVANRWDGPTAYVLAFFTHHLDGVWTFNQALSGAREEFYEFCHRGQLDLDPLPQREKRWIEAIASNIERLLEEEGTFRVSKNVAGVYGDVLGHAREKHVRAAIKQLHREGLTLTDGKGEVRNMTIRAPAG